MIAFLKFDWITIVVFLVVIAPWVLFFFRKKRKELSYNISSIPIINHSSELSGKLELLWNDSQAEDTHFVLLELMNTGNLVIKQDDFARDFTINFDEKSNVMELDVLLTKPYSLHPEVKNHGNSIALKPLQLNTGDTIKIKSLVRNHQKDLSVDFNLKGVGEVKSQINTQNLSVMDKRILTIYAIAAAVFSLFLGVYDFRTLPQIYIILVTAMNVNAMYFIYRVLLKYN